MATPPTLDARTAAALRALDPCSEHRPGRVVHFVGRMTDQVFGFIGPATAAFAHSGSGIEQVVVLVDDAQYRHLLPRFHESVALVLTPPERSSWRRWRHSQRALAETLAPGSVKAVHLHGILPCVFGLPVLRAAGANVPVFFSPHGSRSLGGLSRLVSVMFWLLRLTSSVWRPPIVNVTTEGRHLSPLSEQAPNLVESAVDPAFLDVERNEAQHPLIVTGSRTRNPRSVELFAQLAVLLGAEELRIGFNWLGVVDAVSLHSLNSAGVGVFDAVAPAERASRLAAGWVYVAPGGTRGFPIFLVEAMAAGLPCVVVDTDYHRDIIRNEETGFLCGSEADIVRCIARLVDMPELRVSIGRAARREAEARFSERRLRDSVFAAYDLDLRDARPAQPLVADAAHEIQHTS